MKRKRSSVEQIVAILKQAKPGMKVADATRQIGVSEQTLLPVEEAIRRPAAGSGAGAEDAPGRECQAQEAGR